MFKTASLLCLLMFVSALSFGQAPKYKHPAMLGLHLTGSAFNVNPPKGKKEFDAGLAFNYLKGITPSFDLVTSFGGAFPLQIFNAISTNDKRSLLLQADLSARLRMLNRQNWINPYVQAGIGVLNYKNDIKSYALAGTGLQLNYKDVYLLFNAHYRLSLAQNLNNHLHLSIGIAGSISKPVRKARVLPYVFN